VVSDEGDVSARDEGEGGAGRLGIENFVPMRYNVVDGDMANFMRVASVTDDSVMFLDEETVVGKEGKRVEHEVEGVLRLQP